MAKVMGIGMPAAVAVCIIAALLFSGCCGWSGQPVEQLPPLPEGHSGSARQVSMVVSSPGDVRDWTAESIEKSYETAHDSGASMATTYVEWGNVERREGEYDWDDTDLALAMARKNGLRPVVIIKMVSTNHVGILPADVNYTSFSDPAFRARFRKFVSTFLDRHPDTAYLWVGNEIDDYFYNHRGELDGYEGLYLQVCEDVRKNHSGVKVGTISTYHDAKKNGALDIIEKVGAHGDVIGFSLYPQMLNKQPSDTEAIFGEIYAISGRTGRNFSITETAWSSEGFGGSEEAQAEYVGQVFGAYDRASGRAEYLGLFILYDLSDETSRRIGEEYGISDQNFVKWQATLGLRRNDGTPKKAWATYLERMGE